jgi:hypothetical protein
MTQGESGAERAGGLADLRPKRVRAAAGGEGTPTAAGNRGYGGFSALANS